LSLKSWFALWILKFSENKARAISVSRGRRWTGTYRTVEWTASRSWVTQTLWYNLLQITRRTCIETIGIQGLQNILLDVLCVQKWAIKPLH